MTCSNARKLISRLQARDLPADLRAAVAEHVRGCAGCQALTAEYRMLEELLHSQPGVKIPPALFEELQAGVHREIAARSAAQQRERRRQGRSIFARPLVYRGAIALGAAMLLFAGWRALAPKIRPPLVRPTAEYFFERNDYLGLLRALRNPATREAVLQDSVEFAQIARGLARARVVSRRSVQARRLMQEAFLAVAASEGLAIRRSALDTSLQKAGFALRRLGPPNGRTTLGQLVRFAAASGA